MFDPADEPFDEEGYEAYLTEVEYGAIRTIIEEKAKDTYKALIDGKKTAEESAEHTRKMLLETQNQVQLLKRQLETKPQDLAKLVKERAIEVLRGEYKCKFLPKDKVYYIGKHVYEKCQTCNGTHKVKVKFLDAEVSINCPHCNNGQVRTNKAQILTGTITAVSFSIDTNNYDNKLIIRDYITYIPDELAEQAKRNRDISSYFYCHHQKLEGYKPEYFSSKEECLASTDLEITNKDKVK